MNSPPQVERKHLVELTNRLSKVAGDWDNQISQRDELAGVARQLLVETSSPVQLMWTQLANLYTLTSLRVLAQYGVLESFPAGGGITAEELSEKTGVQLSLLRRLLRLPVISKYFTQDDKGAYHHTEASRSFCPAKPLQVILDLLNEHTMASVGHLPEYLKARGSASEPDDPAFNPYTWSRKKDGTSVWDAMAECGELERWSAGINPANEDVFKPAGFYDFGALAEGNLDGRDVLVDVGGGIGAILTVIIEENPALKKVGNKCVLQDLAGPIGQANSGGTLPEGVRTMAHNFFDEQPVKGAKAYYMRRILHDYSDAKCVDILKCISAVCAPDTKLLIAEQVDPLTNKESDLILASMDFIMLNIGGKERSEAQFAKILAAAGFKLAKVYRGPDDSLIEAVPV